jgi:hypothetical protein
MGSNVELGGLRRWQVRRVTVTSTAAVRLDSTSPLAGRNGIEIAASTGNSALAYISPASSVSASTGRALSKLSSPVYLGISTRAEVWAKAASGSQVLFITEVG